MGVAVTGTVMIVAGVILMGVVTTARLAMPWVVLPVVVVREWYLRMAVRPPVLMGVSERSVAVVEGAAHTTQRLRRDRVQWLADLAAARAD